MEGLSYTLARVGLSYARGFFPADTVESCASEIAAAFRCAGRVRRVDQDGIHMRTLNGEALLDACPTIGSMYNLLRDELANAFPTLTDLADRSIGISANCLSGRSDSFRLHFDRNQLTAVVYLNRCTEFPFIVYPNIRRDPKETGGAESFDLTGIEPLKLYPEENLLVVFLGRRSFHGVLREPGASSGPRYSLQFAFDFEANDYGGTDYYGR